MSPGVNRNGVVRPIRIGREHGDYMTRGQLGSVGKLMNALKRCQAALSSLGEVRRRAGAQLPPRAIIEQVQSDALVQGGPSTGSAPA
jgi:hypothetical protein